MSKLRSPRTFANGNIAFTLVEMLVAIGILALLVGLIVPVAGKALGSANTSRCASNLKQLHVAILNYTTDHDQYLPYAFDSASGFTWEYVLASEGYISASRLNKKFVSPVFGCPSQRKAVNQPNVTTYGMNGALCSATTPRKLTTVSSPARTMLMADGYGPQLGSSMPYNQALWDSTVMTPSAAHPEVSGSAGEASNKEGGANVLFADGHVERMNAWEIPAKRWPEGSEQWLFWMGREN